MRASGAAESDSLAGVVTDRKGNELPRAVVQVENVRTLEIRSYVTGSDGRYHFESISSDVDYVVRAKYRNLWSKPQYLSRFDSKKRDNVRIVIPTD